MGVIGGPRPGESASGDSGETCVETRETAQPTPTRDTYERMATFRALVISVLLGALAGIVLATLAADSLISTELCGLTSDSLTSRPCLDTVHQAVAKVIRTQELGALVGAILGLFAGILWVRRKSAKADAEKPGPSPSAPV